jgi:murein L,D-transpeptidase YcbB/YkuD
VLASQAFESAPLTADWDTAAETSVSLAIENLLATDSLVVGGEPIAADDLLREIYRGEAYQPFWTNEKNVLEMLDLVRDAENHGLTPRDYLLDPLNSALESCSRSPTDSNRAEMDVLLTASLVRYAYHRRFGKIKATELDPDINFRREAFSDEKPGELLREILAAPAPAIQSFIDLTAPSGPVYRGVQHALSEYRRIAEDGGWPTIPPGSALRAGDDDPRIATIRLRLVMTGELPGEAGAGSGIFDQPLEQAVKAFQERHALAIDGVIGKNTLAAMNVPVEQRIDQLRATLERLRWINHEAADTLVVVNIAGFSVALISKGEQIWSARAMVGTSYRQTPVFRGEITYVEFNPYWTIPPGIIIKDTLPAVQKDPGYLVERNIRVVDRDGGIVDPYSVDWHQYHSSVPFILRQDPGPKNALGTVKFAFPNSHFVFLHDTPSRELFEKPERAFSSGCIRIEDPLRLAELLLDDPKNYSRSALEAIVDSKATRRVHLDPRIPIVILYATASIAADGNVLFYRDIYDRDSRVLDALDEPVMIDLPTR